VSSGLILLLVFAIPYLTLNVWRLARGRRWAFTFCQVMKEWDAGERIKSAAPSAPGHIDPQIHSGGSYLRERP
jgi:hypothetical protein